MPRRNSRREVESIRPVGGVGATSQDEWRGETYVVRTVPAVSASKAYRCPGCAQAIPAGIPHVVVWPAAAPDAADRRHWHRACWQARDRRPPG